MEYWIAKYQRQIFSSNTLVGSPKIEVMKKRTPDQENRLLSLTNPSRISHRIYLRIPDDVTSIGEELNGLLRPDINGLPTLVTVKNSGNRTKDIYIYI